MTSNGSTDLILDFTEPQAERSQMTKATIRTIVDPFFRLSLLSSVINPPTGYDEDTEEKIVLAVEIHCDGMTCSVATVELLLQRIVDAGVSLSEYARSEPESLATAISYLEDRGRIVLNHPLFTDFAESQRMVLAPFLPSCDGSFLIWYEVPFQYAGTGFVRRSWKLDN